MVGDHVKQNVGTGTFPYIRKKENLTNGRRESYVKWVQERTISDNKTYTAKHPLPKIPIIKKWKRIVRYACNGGRSAGRVSE